MSNMYPSDAEPGYGSFVQRQVDRLVARHGVKVHLVASQRRGGGIANLAKYAGLLFKTLAATVRGDYDLVHAHYLLPVAAFALIPAVVRHKPLVITAHGTDIYTGLRPFWKPWIVRALARACHVIVVSEFLAEALRENFGIAPQPDRVFVIANMGVDLDLFTPGSPGASERAATARAAASFADVAAPAPAHLLFVGNFVEQKGVTDLARALALLAERGVSFRATLLGDGPQMAEVKQVTAPLGDAVRFAKPVPHAQLVEVFRSADLFVLPSRREGVGLLVCLESLACGVPVACGRAGGLPEIVHDGVNGVTFEPSNPVGLADALQGLLGDPERLAQLASNARASALPFGEAEQADMVYRVYEECAGCE